MEQFICWTEYRNISKTKKGRAKISSTRRSSPKVGKRGLIFQERQHKVILRLPPSPRVTFALLFHVFQTRFALACDTSVLKPEGKVVTMRDGFHSCTLVTSSGNVFELNSSLEPRKLEFGYLAQGQGSEQRVIDAVMGWEHSLWLVEPE